MIFAPPAPQPFHIVPKPAFSLEWTTKKENRDVDLALLTYNAFGQLLQVCFDAELLQSIGVVHSGDNSGGGGSGGNGGKESIAIDFNAIPANVQFIVIAVTVPPPSTSSAAHAAPESISDVFSDMSLQCPQFGYRCSFLQLVQAAPAKEAVFCHNFVPLFCVRSGNTPVFQMHPINAFDMTKEGQIGGFENVWRLAETVVHQCVDPALWNEVPHSHVQMLNLKKNQVVHLPSATPKPSGKKAISSLPAAGTFFPLKMIGLGWSPNSKPGESFDVDLHAFSLDVDTNKVIDHVFYRNKTSKDGALQLSGDDRTGDGDEDDDDEQMFVSLKKINSKIDAIFIVVQIFTGQTFGRVSNEFCRAVDEKGNVMARFALDKEPKFDHASAAVMCVLRRDPSKVKESSSGGGWMMSAVGEPISRNDVETDEKAYKTLVKFL